MSDSAPCMLCSHLAMNHELHVGEGALRRQQCLMCRCPLFVPEQDECRVCGCGRHEHALGGHCGKHAGCTEYAGLKLKRSTLTALAGVVMARRSLGPGAPVPGLPEDLEDRVGHLELAARHLIRYEEETEPDNVR